MDLPRLSDFVLIRCPLQVNVNDVVLALFDVGTLVGSAFLYVTYVILVKIILANITISLLCR
jgi:hypothetical protein